MNKKIRTFLSLDLADKWLFLRIVALLVTFQPVTTFLPFRVIAPRIGEVNGTVSPSASLTEEQIVLFDRIVKMIEITGRNLPWSVSCLAKSLCLAQLLKLRELPFVLFIGARVERGEDAKELLAHSWVVSSDRQASWCSERTFAPVCHVTSPILA